MKRFEAQVCVVTGGTQGIGWVMTQALAANGATVYACGFSQDSLEQAEAVRANLPTANQITIFSHSNKEPLPLQPHRVDVDGANKGFDGGFIIGLGSTISDGVLARNH